MPLGSAEGGLRLAGTWAQLVPELFLLQLVLTYIASAVGIGMAALVAIYAVTASVASSVALAVITGLWLALWFAPGVASITSWRKLCAVPGVGR